MLYFTRGGARLSCLLMVIALAGFAACSSSGSSDSTPTSAESAAPGVGGDEAQSGDDAASGELGEGETPGAGSSDLGAEGGSTTSSAAPGDPAAGADGERTLHGPPPMNFPYKTPLNVKSTLDPTCVERGHRVNLSVRTGKPEAAIVYNAVYSDGFGGSGPPFGKGYGGNDKGYTAKDGTYESFWIVSLDAPEGRARVDVVVGYQGKWGYDGPHFAVADENGECPEKWLRSEESDPN